MTGKGPLCVALVVTSHAQKRGLPLDASELVAESGTQVSGLGKAAVQRILEKHSISRVLAEEGGRTSRGSVAKMQRYVEFLNMLHKKGMADLDTVEAWWVEQVKAFFSAKPFILRLDPAKSLRAAVQDVLAQAKTRQEENPGTTYVGTVLQHLVGAKVQLLLGIDVQHHGASVADESSARPADYLIEDVAIHVTNFPSEALIRKCIGNLDADLQPLIVTTRPSLAKELTEQKNVAHRIEIFDVEQFIAGNFYELGKFARAGRRMTAEKLIATYNEIIESCETDPSLRIEIA